MEDFSNHRPKNRTYFKWSFQNYRIRNITKADVKFALIMLGAILGYGAAFVLGVYWVCQRIKG